MRVKVNVIILTKEQGHYRLFYKGKKLLDEDNTFHVGKNSFLADFTQCAYFDKKGRPVFVFTKDNALTTALVPVTQMNHSIEPSSSFFDHMFRRKLWRDSISSALKENKKLSFMDALPLIIGAAGIGLVIGVEIGLHML